MAETIDLSSVLILAEAVAGWFYPRNPTAPLPDIPALCGMRLQMVRRLLGIHSEQDKSTGRTTWIPLGHAQLLRRLRKAGLDGSVSPWRIVDQRAIAACWYQLRTKETFRELEQVRLMNNGQEIPSVNVPWRKDVVEIQKRQKVIAEAEQAIPQYFIGQVNEHFGRQPQACKRAVGL
jgi:hypothetical protein